MQVTYTGTINYPRYITVEINDVRYRISETKFGRLSIIKLDDGGSPDGSIAVYPRTGNAIEIK